MGLFEQWQRGMVLFSYALEAQLGGAKTMAFYEQENREQREQASIILDKKYKLEDENWRLENENYDLKEKLRLSEKAVQLLQKPRPVVDIKAPGDAFYHDELEAWVFEHKPHYATAYKPSTKELLFLSTGPASSYRLTKTMHIHDYRLQYAGVYTSTLLPFLNWLDGADYVIP